MSYTVLHLEKAKGNDSGMSAHIERTINPKNADASRSYLNKEMIAYPDGIKNRTSAIQHRLDNAKLKRKIGTNQVRAIRIMLSGTHETMKTIEKNRQLDHWCDDNLKWLKETFGEENLVSAVLHMDEKTPHIHATVIPIVSGERRKAKNSIELKNAKGNNLKNVSIKIPLESFTVVTGVSGSGKSTLINQTLFPELFNRLNRGKLYPLENKGVKGLEQLEKVIDIDQSPIGRTPRSNTATYTKLFDDIRDIFAQTKDSKIRGYDKGRFSFNVKGGRCEACGGAGINKIEMNFLPDVYVECEVCKGKRYNRETLEVHYKDKNISDVLNMSVEEAYEFFQNIPGLKRKLETLMDVGMNYIKLGQPATTLSGGEAQRIKLASELSKMSRGKTIYILDEPTTGLHFEDIRKLLIVLNRLVEKGNTVVVIEHNLDVIKTADYIIDIGPEGGDKGGTVVASGTPEEIAANEKSYTGKYIAAILNKK